MGEDVNIETAVSQFGERLNAASNDPAALSEGGITIPSVDYASVDAEGTGVGDDAGEVDKADETSIDDLPDLLRDRQKGKSEYP